MYTLIYFSRKMFTHLYIYILYGQFLLQRPRARPCWNLRQFCCPTLEEKPSSFYLIRHEPMIVSRLNTKYVG